MSGNHYYLGLYLELTARKNNFIIGFGLSRINYDTNKSYISRSYENLQDQSNSLQIEKLNYTSKLNSPALVGNNFNVKYERMVYKNKLGVYCKFQYQYNIYYFKKYFEYGYNNLGFNNKYQYYIVDTNGKSYYYQNDYSINFNSAMFSVGVFYKFNFKE